MSDYLILVAGGTGTRMGGPLPKQFIEIAGFPVLYHTLKKFLDAEKDMNIVIAVHPGWTNELDGIIKKYFIEANIQVVEGGETRFHSVKNALEKIKGDGIVLIHDAARPCVSVETITRCIVQTQKHGSAIPVIPVMESLRKINGRKSSAVDREDYRIVQTPQCFKIKEIKKAFDVKYRASFTDDATVFEKAGYKLHLVDGNPENIKLTVPADLNYAEYLLTEG
jgi:2-C-methyl-D-erythritol 4-phosphate cytidylyltransferase